MESADRNRNICDINELIPAWKLDERRPGTVVLISADMHVYNMEDKVFFVYPGEKKSRPALSLASVLFFLQKYQLLTAESPS
jgi:hypothetical protein